MFFWLEPKEPKVQGKTNGSACFSGPTHKDSDDAEVVSFYRSGRTQTLLRTLRSNWRRYFFAGSVYSNTRLIVYEKEALGFPLDRSDLGHSFILLLTRARAKGKRKDVSLTLLVIDVFCVLALVMG